MKSKFLLKQCRCKDHPVPRKKIWLHSTLVKKTEVGELCADKCTNWGVLFQRGSQKTSKGGSKAQLSSMIPKKLYQTLQSASRREAERHFREARSGSARQCVEGYLWPNKQQLGSLWQRTIKSNSNLDKVCRKWWNQICTNTQMILYIYAALLRHTSLFVHTHFIPQINFSWISHSVDLVLHCDNNRHLGKMICLGFVLWLWKWSHEVSHFHRRLKL